MTDLPPEIQRDRDVERLAKKAKLPPYMWDTLEALAALGRFMDAAIAARPEEQAWNAAIESVVKLLRSNADGCSPGSAAEVQNWPFVLETMARAVEKMRRDMNYGST